VTPLSQRPVQAFAALSLLFPAPLSVRSFFFFLFSFLFSLFFSFSEGTGTSRQHRDGHSVLQLCNPLYLFFFFCFTIITVRWWCFHTKHPQLQGRERGLRGRWMDGWSWMSAAMCRFSPLGTSKVWNMTKKNSRE